jgi:catechol 2,3-dioxygenase-like lactoylglutathione lyase family enzyme
VTWPKGIHAITLFVEDLVAAREFYQRVFGLPIHYEDADSTVFNFGNVVINLLAVSQAPELIAPAAVAGPEAGARMQFSIEVGDVDAMVVELQSRGVQVLNGPMNRPWGIRTATFADPAGHIWEIVGETAGQ